MGILPCICSKMSLQCSEPGGPMGISVVLHILLIAHGSIPYLFVTLLHVLLLMNHVAPSGAVYTLACVHAQGLQVHSETRPSCKS